MKEDKFESKYNVEKHSYFMDVKEEILLMYFNNDNFFTQNGYSKEEIIRMVKAYSYVFSYYHKSMKELIIEKYELGFSKEKIMIAASLHAKLYFDMMKDKFDYIMELGYSYNQVIEMTKKYPEIYAYDNIFLKDKLEENNFKR